MEEKEEGYAEEEEYQQQGEWEGEHKRIHQGCEGQGKAESMRASIEDDTHHVDSEEEEAEEEEEGEEVREGEMNVKVDHIRLPAKEQKACSSIQRTCDTDKARACCVQRVHFRLMQEMHPASKPVRTKRHL